MAFLKRLARAFPLLAISPVLMAISAIALFVTDLLYVLRSRPEHPHPAAGGQETRAYQKASVVIPNWNGKDLLARYLPSVVEALAGNPENEILVVDNGSTDGSAEFVRAPEVNCLPYPENLKWEEAASIPLVFQTAWHMLVTRAELQPGEDVLILGAGSGVGTAAIQIAKFFGARVITTAGSEEKLAKAKELGADHLINHKTQKIREEVRRITNKRGVDVVFEHVGTATWGDSLASLAPAGRLVTCGATTGYDAKVDLRFLFSRQLSLLGSYMGTKSELHTVMKLVALGRLKPVVDRVFPLAEAAAAHAYLESGSQFGKVVLTV